MKLKIKRNLNHVAKNQPHESHTSHVTIKTKNKKILAMQPCKSTSHAKTLKGDLGCVLVC